MSGKVIGVLQVPQSCNLAGDLPDVSKCFHGIAQAGDRRANCMGLFSIFWFGASARLAPAWPQADLEALPIDRFRFPHQHRYQAVHANTGAYPDA